MTPLRPVLAAVALVAAVAHGCRPTTPEPAPTTTVATITHIDGPATATVGADRCGTTEVAP